MYLIFIDFFFFCLFYVCELTRVLMWVLVWSCGGQSAHVDVKRINCSSVSLPSCVLGPRMELRSLSLMSDTFNHWAILLAPFVYSVLCVRVWAHIRHSITMEVRGQLVGSWLILQGCQDWWQMYLLSRLSQWSKLMRKPNFHSPQPFHMGTWVAGVEHAGPGPSSCVSVPIARQHSS